MRLPLLGSFLVLGGLLGLACGDDDAGGAAPGGGDAGSSGGDGGGSSSGSGSDGGGGEGGPGGNCTLTPATETFGVTDATKFVDIGLSGSGLPMNARAGGGRLIVDGCGFHMLQGVDGNYSVYTANPPTAAFNAVSTTTIDGIREIRSFVKVGEDFAVVAQTRDNKSYLYRMAAAGGPLTKVVSEPLINGDFGMESIAVTPTQLFFNSYRDGAFFALRSAPVSSFASGTLPLAEPMGTDNSDNARYAAVHAWGDLVSFGNKNFAQSCVPEANVGCTQDPISGVPNIRYAIGTSGDGIYTWLQGTLAYRAKSAAATVETKPAGLASNNDDLVSASISPDGNRIALVGRSSGALRLHLITDAKSSPKGTSINLPPDADGDTTVWTNGKVAIIVWTRSRDTKPLAVQGVAWP